VTAEAARAGYPTANLDIPAEVALPGEGIYACRYERSDGSVHGAAASVGYRPTFHARNGAPLLEAFLLDFDGDLYGEPARVSFVADCVTRSPLPRPTT